MKTTDNPILDLFNQDEDLKKLIVETFKDCKSSETIKSTVSLRQSVISEAGSMGNIETIPSGFVNDIKLRNAYAEQIVEESELMIRRIDHIYIAAKEELEISLEKKEITPEEFFTLCEIQQQNYLKLISQVKTKRASLLADRCALWIRMK